jgi:hypothetical protein
MAIERIKLTVKEVSEPKQVGNKGAQKLQFKATTPENKELSYFTFSTRLFEHIKAGVAIDADVDTTTSEHGGNTYTDRKVTQIYIDGQALGGQGRQSGGWEKRDNTASIEAQTAAKIGCELLVAGLVKSTEPLGSRVIEWCLSRLGVEVSKPEQSKEPEKPAGLNRIAGIDMDWLRESLAALQKAHPQEWSNVSVIEKLNKITGKAAKSVSEAVRPLNAKQAQEFVQELQEKLNKGG